jgi:hypothetical protein
MQTYLSIHVPHFLSAAHKFFYSRTELMLAQTTHAHSTYVPIACLRVLSSKACSHISMQSFALLKVRMYREHKDIQYMHMVAVYMY